jgi:hypothetical protein
LNDEAIDVEDVAERLKEHFLPKTNENLKKLLTDQLSVRETEKCNFLLSMIYEICDSNLQHQGEHSPIRDLSLEENEPGTSSTSKPEKPLLIEHSDIDSSLTSHQQLSQPTILPDSISPVAVPMNCLGVVTRSRVRPEVTNESQTYGSSTSSHSNCLVRWFSSGCKSNLVPVISFATLTQCLILGTDQQVQDKHNTRRPQHVRRSELAQR